MLTLMFVGQKINAVITLHMFMAMHQHCHLLYSTVHSFHWSKLVCCSRLPTPGFWHFWVLNQPCLNYFVFMLRTCRTVPAIERFCSDPHLLNESWKLTCRTRWCICRVLQKIIRLEAESSQFPDFGQIPWYLWLKWLVRLFFFYIWVILKHSC